MVHPRQQRGRRSTAALLLLLLPTACGLRPAAPLTPAAADSTADLIAPGVRYVSESVGTGGGVDLIDITLPNPAVAVRIVARGLAVRDGTLSADARLPRDWVDDGALAAINGGYFGRDQGGGRKEIVGLLCQAGKVVHPAPPITGHGTVGLPPARYVRSGFGLLARGTPAIAWVATDPAHPARLYAYSGPTMPPAARVGAWRPIESLGCGPTLIHDGRTVVTDREERLSSDEPRERTFVAYDSLRGGTRHLLLGASSPMAYESVAAYLVSYFHRAYGATPEAAMCLDGGPSTQLSYRQGGHIVSPRDTGVTVPVCVVVTPIAPASHR